MADRLFHEDVSRGDRGERFFMANYQGGAFASSSNFFLLHSPKGAMCIEGKDVECLGVSGELSSLEGDLKRLEIKTIANFLNRNNDGDELTGTIPLEIFGNGDNWGWLVALHSPGVYAAQKSKRLALGETKIIAKPTELIYVLMADEDMQDPFAVIWFEWEKLEDLLCDPVAENALESDPLSFIWWQYPEDAKDLFWKTNKGKRKYIIGNSMKVWHVPFEMIRQAAYITVDVKPGQDDEAAAQSILQRVKARYLCPASVQMARIMYLLKNADVKTDFNGKHFDRTMLER